MRCFQHYFTTAIRNASQVSSSLSSRRPWAHLAWSVEFEEYYVRLLGAISCADWNPWRSFSSFCYIHPDSCNFCYSSISHCWHSTEFWFEEGYSSSRRSCWRLHNGSTAFSLAPSPSCPSSIWWSTSFSAAHLSFPSKCSSSWQRHSTVYIFYSRFCWNWIRAFCQNWFWDLMPHYIFYLLSCWSGRWLEICGFEPCSDILCSDYSRCQGPCRQLQNIRAAEFHTCWHLRIQKVDWILPWIDQILVYSDMNYSFEREVIAQICWEYDLVCCLSNRWPCFCSLMLHFTTSLQPSTILSASSVCYNL